MATTQNAVPRPGFYFVGAPKAGTSALSQFLTHHPQIGMCRIKEPNFHCPDFDLPRPKTEEKYLELFPFDAETEILADCSALYLYSQVAAARIRAYTPDARILMVLRNPVEAMYSWHSQMVFTANEPISDFAHALEAEGKRKAGQSLPSVGNAARCPAILFYRDVMRYPEQVERYLLAFERDQIRILLYDDLATDPERTYASVLEFLGLRPFRPDFRKVNPNKERRSWRLHYWLKRAFAAPARAWLPLRLRLRLIQLLDRVNTREVRRPAMDPALERRLKEECRPDVERLSEILGRDLQHWCR